MSDRKRKVVRKQEYVIYKKRSSLDDKVVPFPGQDWEGPFSTLLEAKEWMKPAVEEVDNKAKEYRIVRVTTRYTEVPVR